MTLIGDVSEKVVVAAGKTVAIDLNGHAVATKNPAIENNGTLTLVDSSAAKGSITVTDGTAYSYVVKNKSTGVLTLEGVVIEGGAAQAVYNDKGTIESIENCVISGRSGVKNNKGTVSSMKNSEITGDLVAVENSIEAKMGAIDGCRIFGGQNALMQKSGNPIGSVVGCVIESRDDDAIVLSANGGAIDQLDSSVSSKTASALRLNAGVRVSITGGSYVGAAGVPALENPTSGMADVSIVAGTFSTRPAISFVADGKTVVASGSGYVVVDQLVPPSEDDANALGEVVLEGSAELNPTMSKEAAKLLDEQATSAAESLIAGEGTGSVAVADPDALIGAVGAIGRGDTVVATLIVSVDAVEGDGASQADVEKINGFKSSTEEIVPFTVNLDMVVSVSDEAGNWKAEASAAVVQIENPVAVTLDAPDDVDLQKAFLRVARVHDAQVDVLEAQVDETAGSVTFETDRFSTYALLSSTKSEVLFDSMGGSPVESRLVAFGEKVGEPKAPVREGYRFSGWYADSSCATKWDFHADVVAKSSTMTLYAGWDKVEGESAHDAGTDASDKEKALSALAKTSDDSPLLFLVAFAACSVAVAAGAWLLARRKMS